ncbi:hypothetical protein BGZ97_010304, partial [Linnemannia gamsii]
MRLFPSSFCPRVEGLDTELAVRPLDKTAVAILSPTSKEMSDQSNYQRNYKRDLKTIFSEHHFRYLQIRHCGPNMLQMMDKTLHPTEDHPLWRDLSICIDADTVAAGILPRTLDYDLSHLGQTINILMTEMSTSFTNMWQGPLYDKLLGYLLRILLRLHLAPEREAAYKERLKRLSERSKMLKEMRFDKSLSSPKAWKSKVRTLQNDLFQAVRRYFTLLEQDGDVGHYGPKDDNSRDANDNDNSLDVNDDDNGRDDMDERFRIVDRITMLSTTLDCMLATKPIPRNGDLPSLQVQLEQSKA